MRLTMKAVVLLSSVCLLLLVRRYRRGTQENAPIAIVAYSSNDPDKTLLWGSTTSHQSEHDDDAETVKLIAVGKDMPLFNQPIPGSNDTFTMRGWMFRFRTMVDGIVQELADRNDEDFLVVIGDAFDTYLTESSDGHTMDLVKDRFETEFGNYSIVFSSQIYCCNPWNLHEVGRAGWDEYYNRIGGPETVYKHLNAGMFMGKASAIVEMAHEMKIWDTVYKRPEEFDNILRARHDNNEPPLHMFDADVDDDEWQLSVWFLKEQLKARPRAALDMKQSLFTTTGTFRASHRDGGFLIFSQDDFYGVVGTLPPDFDRHELDQIKQCPYEYDTHAKLWTNTITQSHPLIFHFAGNDWLCACQVLSTDHFGDVTQKFAESCQRDFPLWQTRVNQAVQQVSSVGMDPKQQIFLKGSEESTAVIRQLQGGYGSSPTMAPTMAPASTLAPVATVAPEATLVPVSFAPAMTTTGSPASMAPAAASIAPESSIPATTSAPVPTTVAPVSMTPVSMAPVSVAPAMTLAPAATMAPASLAPVSMVPAATAAPASVAPPASLAPASLVPAVVSNTTYAPTMAPISSNSSNCSIVRFDLWNGMTDTVSLANFTTGSAFCSSTFPVSIEAIGETCVRNVRFDLTGPDGYSFRNREYVAPYFLFGNTGNYSYINGRIMRPGNYSLLASPNRGQGTTALLQFYVDSC